MNVPEPFLAYLVHFHADRDYFECHEVLEEYWKSLPSPRDPLWVGLIQLAVSLYHHRRGNLAGAQKMLTGAIRILSQRQDRLSALGLDAATLIHLLELRLAEVEAGVPYSSMNLPIADASLLEACRRESERRGLVFGAASRMDDPYLLHKHSRRDRRDIIAARERSLREKQSRRNRQ